MTLEKWSPFRDLQVLQNRFNRLFDSYYDREIDASGDLTTKWYPTTNIYETDNAYVLKLDVPGIKKEDIHIEFKDGSVIISGERKEEKEFAKENVQRVEASYGQFTRSFIIPKNIDQNKIEANLKEGVLEVKITKAEESKPKSIPIK